MMQMDGQMIQKIDSALERAKEPESNLSVAELGIVRRCRYKEHENSLYVFADQYASKKACCFLLTKMLEVETLERLQGELEKEFPDLTVKVV